MDLKSYAQSRGGTGTAGCEIFAEIAKKARCHIGTLYQVSLGHKKASAKLAYSIELATEKQVTRADLRPDYFSPAPTERAA